MHFKTFFRSKMLLLGLMLMGSQAMVLGYVDDFVIDDFDTPYDFLAEQGVGLTGWDGFFGSKPNETAHAINIDIDREGMLYLASEGANWDTFNDYGPFLYKLVDGDFKATTYIGDFPGLVNIDDRTEHNDSFIMARDPEGSPDAENFESIHYFPTWVGIWGRDMIESVETEWGATGDGFDCARYLQLERIGNDFYFRYSHDGVTWEELSGSPVTRDDMPSLLQVGVGHCTYSPALGYVAFEYFEIDNVPPNPYCVIAMRPYRGSTDIDREVTFEWIDRWDADVYHIYLGTDELAVSQATMEDPMEVLAVSGLEETQYTLTEPLDFGQTYYWRVEEVNLTTLNSCSSRVLSFTTEPYSYTVENITATASHRDPIQTVNGSGLVEGKHSATESHMWNSGFLTSSESPIWIQYDLNEPFILDELWIWNGNSDIYKSLGLGVNEVNIEYSIDGTHWTLLEDVNSLNQAPGAAGYICNNVIDMNEIEARYVKLNVLSNFGTTQGQHFDCYMISEVQFTYIPLTARVPSPQSGSPIEELHTELKWRTGRTATSHRIYLGTDEQDVLDETALLAEVSDRRHDVNGLEYDRVYYWKVNEVADEGIYPGPIWSFSTPAYLTIDDFKDYYDCFPVFERWIDGWYDQPNNGAIVGYPDYPFMEEDIVYELGGQSMPYYYDTDGGTKTAEATLPLGGQDWTVGGVQTLFFAVWGERSNTDGHLYVKINDSKITCPANLAAGLWIPIHVDLSSSGADLNDVQSLTIGVEGTGAGLFYVDEIRLYRYLPGPVYSQDPGSDDLILQYSFEDNLQDSSGNAYHATAVKTMTYDVGFEGQALYFDGIEDSVNVPLAESLASLTQSTFAAWVCIDPASEANWSRVFDFGTGTDAYLYLCPRVMANPYDLARVGLLAEGSKTEICVTSPQPRSGWHHLAATFGNGLMTLYVDGRPSVTETNLSPQDIGTPQHLWLGRSPLEVDDLFHGWLDELLIYERTLTEGEIRYLAGDRD